MLGAFHDIWKNIYNSFFQKKNFLWHLLATVLTYISVMSGFDWLYHLKTTGNLIQLILFPAEILGGIVPILLPVILFIWGKFIKNKEVINQALAVAQAAFLGWLISSFYKAFTGRPEPPFRDLSNIDISHTFQFGILKHGIFWGWPSSHTTVAFAVAITIFVLNRNRNLIKYFTSALALYIGIGVSVNIHWFSDFLAGAIIGSVIGVTVGKSFLFRLENLNK